MQKEEFEKYLKEELPTLRLKALGLTGDKQNADDLVQDSLLCALNNLEACYGSGCFNGWIHTIMKHSFLNERRRNLHYKAIIESLADDEYLPYNEIVENISVKETMNLINSFSEEYRKAFQLHISGYQYHEIAECLSIPLGTVKSRIFSVRKNLKEKLSQRN